MATKPAPKKITKTTKTQTKATTPTIAAKPTVKTAKSVSAKKSTSARKSPARSRTAVKKNSVDAAEIKTPVVENTIHSDQSAKKTKSFRISKVYVITVIIIALLGFALYNFRGLFVAAVVNGQPISRLTVVQAAEKQSGKQSLDTLVRNILIEQEAKKEGVTVSDSEVSDQMKTVQAKLASQGQNIDQVLAMQGMSKDDLRKLMRLDRLVQKMVGKNIKVSSKQVDDYIAQNKDSLPQNQDQTKLRQTVQAQLQQQELQQKVQAWLTTLQSKAKILYFVQY